jgi:carbon-monoxide dehydrogenase medium subunit
MKAPPFEYIRPQSLEAAIGYLVAGRGEARVVAGGQSLLAMMNLRLAAPELLVDISRLPQLSGASEDRDEVVLGAGITHAMIEDRRVPDPSRGLMPQVAAGLAYRAIRNRGTIGGSLALADPAAEWPAVLTALDATATVSGPGGRRAIKCGQFATGMYQTQLGEEEIVDGVRVAKLSPEARWGYAKLARKAGEFATALAVAVVDRARGFCRVVAGAAGGPPLVLPAASRALADRQREPNRLREAVDTDLGCAADRQFDEFQRRLHRVAAVRAIVQAMM